MGKLFDLISLFGSTLAYIGVRYYDQHYHNLISHFGIINNLCNPQLAQTEAAIKDKEDQLLEPLLDSLMSEFVQDFVYVIGNKEYDVILGIPADKKLLFLIEMQQQFPDYGFSDFSKKEIT